MTIYNIVQKLIGATYPVGETNTDNDRYENLIEFIELYEEMTEQLILISKLKDRGEYSLKRAGKLASQTLNN